MSEAGHFVEGLERRPLGRVGNYYAITPKHEDPRLPHTHVEDQVTPPPPTFWSCVFDQTFSLSQKETDLCLLDVMNPVKSLLIWFLTEEPDGDSE